MKYISQVRFDINKGSANANDPIFWDETQFWTKMGFRLDLDK